MKLKLSNLKHIKTTLIGLLCIAVAVGGVFLVEDFNVWIFGISLGVGIIMFFSPDSLISGLRNFIKSNDDSKVLGGVDCEHESYKDGDKDDLAQ